MLEPIALKGARWVLRRGRGSNALSLSDVRHEVARSSCCVYLYRTQPNVLSLVSYQSVRHWQRWGAKPLGQCNLIHIGWSENREVDW